MFQRFAQVFPASFNFFRLEAFTYEVLLAILRGSAYIYLGIPPLDSMTIPGCAGQFQIQLTPGAQKTRRATFQMAISPYHPHSHYGFRCYGHPQTYTPVGDAMLKERRMVYQLDPARDIHRHVGLNFFNFLTIKGEKYLI